MKPIQRYFNFTSDGTNHDATVDETSEPLESCLNWEWNVAPSKSGLTGANPIYTIEVSSDGVTWFDYNSLSTDVDIDDAVCDDHLTFTHMRIKHQSNGATGGTVQYLLTQKPS